MESWQDYNVKWKCMLVPWLYNDMFICASNAPIAQVCTFG